MHEVLLPQLTETMEEGTVRAWLKEPGAFVEAGEPLFEVETDKMNVEVEALESGYLCEVQVAVGETVAVNTVLAVLADDLADCPGS
jgi:pyruvate dehydrogenase E2 component (dihydrolipoamide acetyltransferase)